MCLPRICSSVFLISRTCTKSGMALRVNDPHLDGRDSHSWNLLCLLCGEGAPWGGLSRKDSPSQIKSLFLVSSKHLLSGSLEEVPGKMDLELAVHRRRQSTRSAWYLLSRKTAQASKQRLLISPGEAHFEIAEWRVVRREGWEGGECRPRDCSVLSH